LQGEKIYEHALHNGRLAALLMVGGTILGCQAIDNTTVSDSSMTSRARIALFADSRVKGLAINVETTEGQVMLKGTVDSVLASQAAEEIAKNLDGVKSVKNNLEVITSSVPEAVAKKDDDITTHVKANPAKDPQLMNTKIIVQTKAGVVLLKLEVQDLMTSANGFSMAWHLPGVQSVKNNLVFKEKA